MRFLIDRAFEQALEYLTERTEPENMPAVKRLLNEAMDKYEDGELTDAEAKRLVDKLLPLVKPEARDEIQQMFNTNFALISRYLN